MEWNLDNPRHYAKKTMKIIEYDKIPDITQVEIKSNPMSVWLDTHTQLVIEKGDTIAEIEKTIAPYFSSHLTRKERRQLIAYWFAMGERSHRGRIDEPWETRETRPSKSRKYLKRGSI